MPRRIGYSTFSEVFSGGDYTPDEWEFIQAVAAYQKRWNRRYPSWREVLAILRELGYAKAGKSETRSSKSETKPEPSADTTSPPRT